MIDVSRRGILGGVTGVAPAGEQVMVHTAAAAAHDELATMDATETAARIRSREISAREAVEAAIRRVERVNPSINAVIRTRFEQALSELPSPGSDAPFAGVPALIKDAVIAGEPFYYGNRVYADLDWRPQTTHTFVERMWRAGLVIIGVTNIPEFTSSPSTESQSHGPCRNPWNLSRSVGGSSGGSGAAVAALMAPVAQSSDGGGSSRIPASANGLFTIKLTRGRTPLGPGNSCWSDISSSKSFITRSVRDFAALVDAIGGPDLGETLTAPPLQRPLRVEVRRNPGRLRIGVATTLPGNLMPLDAEALAAATSSAQLLSELGHEVVGAAPATFTSAESLEIIRAYWPSKVAARAAEAEHALGRALTENDLEPATYQQLAYARSHTMADFALAIERISHFTRRSLAWWEEFDVLLTPATGTPPPPIGAMSDISTREGGAAAFRWGGMCAFANITGQPAASVPLYWTSDGLPIGTQLVANVGREDLLVRLAAQLERARPWRRRVAQTHG